MILALETATNICSVALKTDTGSIVEKRSNSRGSHSEKLFLFIKELMEEQAFSIEDLSAVLVSEGPGSYTGLRIAASGVKGLLFGTEVPLYGISTLASFACAALENHPAAKNIHSIIDARRVHVYHQPFIIKDERIEAVDEVNVIPIKSFEKKVQPGDIIIGTGLNRLDENLITKVKHFGKDLISARSLIALFHRDEAKSFIQKIAPAMFDPRYYTSQV